MRSLYVRWFVGLFLFTLPLSVMQLPPVSPNRQPDQQSRSNPNLQVAQELSRYGQGAHASNLVWSPDDTAFALQTDLGTWIYRHIDMPFEPILLEGRYLPKYSQISNLLALSIGSSFEIRDADTLDLIKTISRPGEGVIYNLQFDLLGKKIVLSDSNESIEVWSIETMSKIADGKPHNKSSCSW